MLVQQPQDCVRLLLLQADDAPRELRVDEEGLLARDGVAAHERVDVLDGLALDNTAAVTTTGELGLLNARMDDLERLKVGSEIGGEVVVGTPGKERL